MPTRVEQARLELHVGRRPRGGAAIGERHALRAGGLTRRHHIATRRGVIRAVGAVLDAQVGLVTGDVDAVELLPGVAVRVRRGHSQAVVRPAVRPALDELGSRCLGADAHVDRLPQRTAAVAAAREACRAEHAVVDRHTRERRNRTGVPRAIDLPYVDGLRRAAVRRVDDDHVQVDRLDVVILQRGADRERQVGVGDVRAAVVRARVELRARGVIGAVVCLDIGRGAGGHRLGAGIHADREHALRVVQPRGVQGHAQCGSAVNLHQRVGDRGRLSLVSGTVGGGVLHESARDDQEHVARRVDETYIARLVQRGRDAVQGKREGPRRRSGRIVQDQRLLDARTLAVVDDVTRREGIGEGQGAAVRLAGHRPCAQDAV